MSIQGLAGTSANPERRPAAARRDAPSCAAFRSRLETAAAAAAGGTDTLHLCMGEDVAFSGGVAGKRGKFQEFCAHYTEDSTPQDPIVHISGTADSGPFDFICHLNSVDPANTSYAELAALRGHLAKTGRAVTGTGPLPDTMEFREDVTRKYDFISGIRNSLSGPSHILPSAASIAGANGLLALYQNYSAGPAGAAPAPGWPGTASGEAETLDDARLLLLRRTKEGQEWRKEQEEWDRLLKCLDSWIDALRDAADREREERGVMAEGGGALLAMYRNLVAGAARADAAGEARSAEDLLSALAAAQSELLERLKEDRAAEEEREDWADLLRRLDRWIDDLRGVREEERARERIEAVSAAGERTNEYRT